MPAQPRRRRATTPASRCSIRRTWRRVSFAIGGRFEHNASFGNAFVPRGSVAYVVHTGGAESEAGATTVHVAAGKGIKEPTLLQSFSPSPFFLGNPDLKPERSRSVEVGIDQRLAARSGPRRRSPGSTTIFWT